MKCQNRTFLLRPYLRLCRVSILLLVLISSCKIDPFLKNNEYVVRKNNVKIIGTLSKKQKAALESQMPTLYKQRELPQFMFRSSKLGAYYALRQATTNDTSRFWRWQYKRFAKRPSIYNNALTEATLQNMRQYLKNAGYVNPQVRREVDTIEKQKLVDVRYFVEPGIAYVIDSVSFITQDTAIQYLLNDTRNATRLTKGAKLSTANFDAEKQRIVTTLQDFGFARFNANYISPLLADTIGKGFDKFGNKKTDIVLRVQVPPDRSRHLKFSNAEVIIYPNFDPRLGETQKEDTVINGKVFYTYNDNLGLRGSLLDNAVKLQTFDIFRKTDVDRTLRTLSNLDIYKFVSLRSNIEQCDSTLVQHKIYLTPSKKMNFEAGLEFNYSNIPQGQERGRVGLAGNLGFSHKNLFKGAEKFSSKITAGFDIGLTNRINLARDVRFENSLTVPKFISPWGALHTVRRAGLLSDSLFHLVRENASSGIVANYILSDRANLFLTQNINIGLKHNLLMNNGLKRIAFTPTNFDFFISDIRENFENTVLKNNPALRESFQSQVATGIIFNALNFTRTSPQSILGNRWHKSFFFEQSGAEMWLAEKAFNGGNAFVLRGGNSTTEDDDVGFSKFVKTEIDLRYTRQIRAKQAFAVRTAVGLAVPYGKSNAAVPYLKQFYVGGPNSIRAYQARVIGGGVKLDSTERRTPYLTGDMKFEINSEYRFPMFWLFESAIFFDVGNVWTLKDATNRGRAITSDWYKQLAVGSGFGLRLDVTYALIRIDFGFPLRRPYDDGSGGQWISPRNYKLSTFNPNFALGFPF